LNVLLSSVNSLNAISCHATDMIKKYVFNLLSDSYVWSSLVIHFFLLFDKLWSYNYDLSYLFGLRGGCLTIGTSSLSSEEVVVADGEDGLWDKRWPEEDRRYLAE